MKHKLLNKFLTLALLTLGGVINPVWADSYTLTAKSGFGASYGSDHTFTSSSIGYKDSGVMYNGSGSPTGFAKQQVIQMRKSGSSGGPGTIYNTTAINTITSVEITLVNNNNSFTLYYGTSENPSTNSIASSSLTPTTGSFSYTNSSGSSASATSYTLTFDLSSYNPTYIRIVNGSSANYVGSIVINYTPAHTLTYSATNGSISGVVYNTSTAVASGASVAEGGKVTLTATPTSGYAFSGWEVSGTGATISSTTDNPTTFTMGTADATVTANFVSSSVVATPTFSVDEGTYYETKSVEISCATDDATIYYTTDGTNPTTSSSVYSSAISVTQTTTIKAFAVKDGLTDSGIASATYTLKCATPAFSPAEGEVVYGVEVEIICDTEGATIHYTTDDSTPTSSSPTYSSAISITEDMVIQAIAIKANWDNSEVADATYLLKEPDAPTFSPAAGAVAEGSTVTISSDEGTTIYYTTNGDTPTESSSVYSTGITINEAQTIKAIAVDGGGNSSDVASAAYTTYKANISLSAAQTLTFDDFSGIGTYDNPKSADFPASDGNSYRMTGAQFGYYSSSLQMKKSAGELTSGTITTPNGFTLSVTSAQNPPTVKFGDVLTAASSTSSGTSYYSCASTSTTFTLIASTSGATQVTEISITANKAANTITATTARSIDRTKSESSITLDATSTSGSVTYAVKSSTIDSEDYSFNTSTGVLTVTGTYSGTIVITASSAATSSYEAAEDVDITVSVIGTKTDPTIAVSDDNVTYGDSYVLDTSGFSSGAVSLVSGNTSIATVEGLTITPVAVGTVTITVNTASSAMYNEGSTTFDLTVEEPEGKTTAVKGVATSTYTMDFTDNSEWGFPSTSSKGVDPEDYNDGTYTITLEGTSGNGYGFNSTDKYLILGKSGSTLTFQAFDKFVTQIDVTGRSGASGSVTQNIYVGSTAVSTETTGATGKNEYVINSAYQAPGTIYTLKVTNANNTQITKIVIHFTDVATSTVTLNKYGYATCCSVNPIDFSSTTGYTAWRVSNITADGTITFTKITEKIKGGQGVLLYNKEADGDNTSIATITFGAGTTEFTSSENKLVGTTAPVYIDEVAKIYGLSDNKFVKNNATGNIGANKAYILATSIPASVKAFNFVFEDEDDPDGIRTIENVSIEEAAQIFDLLGRRLNKAQKGINIINGKKVLY